MQEIISWYMEHKTYGNILIIGIIGLMLYNIGYGVGTDIYRIFGWLVIGENNICRSLWNDRGIIWIFKLIR